MRKIRALATLAPGAPHVAAGRDSVPNGGNVGRHERGAERRAQRVRRAGPACRPRSAPVKASSTLPCGRTTWSAARRGAGPGRRLGHAVRGGDRLQGLCEGLRWVVRRGRLMKTGEYDGGAVSGDATLRLIAGGDVRP